MREGGCGPVMGWDAALSCGAACVCGAQNSILKRGPLKHYSYTQLKWLQVSVYCTFFDNSVPLMESLQEHC